MNTVTKTLMALVVVSSSSLVVANESEMQVELTELVQHYAQEVQSNVNEDVILDLKVDMVDGTELTHPNQYWIARTQDAELARKAKNQGDL